MCIGIGFVFLDPSSKVQIQIKNKCEGCGMIRTNIVLDERLVQAGLKVTGFKTRRKLVDYALRELLRHEDQMKLLELRGKINWEGNLEISRTDRDR